MILLLDYCILFGGYVGYLELCPSMGNIWWRDGHFSPKGIYNCVFYPFKNIRMWWPDMWDINFPMWIIIYIFFKNTITLFK